MKHTLGFILVTCIAIWASGCRSAGPEEAGATFFPDDPEPQTTLILQAQAARGARADATLYPVHFTGSSLNALGRAKLNLMLETGDDPLPVTVYLDLPADDALTAARTDAVSNHLTDAGLLASQFHTTLGPNPAAMHPAAPNLAKLPKTDNPPAESSRGPGASDAQSEAYPDLSGLSNLFGMEKK